MKHATIGEVNRAALRAGLSYGQMVASMDRSAPKISIEKCYYCERELEPDRLGTEICKACNARQVQSSYTAEPNLAHERSCQMCGDSYTPVAHHQKYCKFCKATSTKSRPGTTKKQKKEKK